MNTPPETPAKGHYLAVASLIISIIAMLCFFFPPLQLIVGGIAVILALLSRQSNNSNKLLSQAHAGLFVGTLACISSIFIFKQYLNMFDQLKHDPQWISTFNQIMRDFESSLGINK